jgi:hypothetical protein
MNEILRDRQLVDLIDRIEDARDEVLAILGLSDPEPWDLCARVDRVADALSEVGTYLLRLREGQS